MSGHEVELLRWVHILSMVYWLGGEWAIFQTSYNVVNRHLSLEERRRHMETAYRIDIPARTGIILLLPLGLHMGNLYGLQPLGGNWLVLMWVLVAAWLGLAWSAFIARETDLGIRLTKIDEAIRYFVIPALLYVSISSLTGNGPLTVGEGSLWYPSKMLIYSLTLVIGLYLRFVMRSWTIRFRRLALGPNPVEEAALEREIATSRYVAYLYWILIASVCFLGSVKPF